jgi:alpha-ribazole phosphatase
VIRLVRHPPVDAGGRCYGRLDLPLADPADADLLAARIGPVARTVWTSPAQRCRLVAARLGPHRVDARLQELDFGAWEGMAWDAVPRAMLDAWAADPWNFAPPGGESAAALAERVRAVAPSLEDGDVLITHGGPLRMLAAVLTGGPIDPLAPAPPPSSIQSILAREHAR